MDINEYIRCPITKEIIWQPVLAEDGYIYEKTAIEKWFKNNYTSPCTNLIIKKTLTPVHSFKQLINYTLEQIPELNEELFTGYNTYSNNK